MEQEYLDQAEKYPTLGPHYFAARDAVNKITETFPFEAFAPIVKRAVDDIYGQLLEHVQNSLMLDTDYNIGGEVHRRIDDSVKALMTGEKWALDRYALMPQYGDGEKIREAVARHIPAELQDARIKDMEARIKTLETDLAYHRAR
jgi:hypothetical protein